MGLQGSRPGAARLRDPARMHVAPVLALGDLFGDQILQTLPDLRMILAWQLERARSWIKRSNRKPGPAKITAG